MGKRLGNLVRCAGLCGLLLAGIAAAAAQQRPNILFIAVDDLKCVLGHTSEEAGSFLQMLYPEAQQRAAIRRVLTPNMDRLAAGGVCFHRAYCAEALCNPSRTALLTGIQPHRSQIHGNQRFFRDSEIPAVRNAVTLPQYLRRQGYYTAGVGKIFHTASAQFDQRGRIVRDIPDQAHSWDLWINGLARERTGVIHRSPWSLPEGLFTFGAEPGATEQTADYRKADVIARALEQGRVTERDVRTGQVRTLDLTGDRPFFLACGIFRPHLPWNAPRELLDLYDPNALALDRRAYEAVLTDLADLPPGGIARTTALDNDGQPTSGRFLDLLRHGRRLDPENGDLRAWREAVRHYLASVTLADRCVGRLLDALERSRFRDKTIVVLWSDHGWMLGTKHRMHKVALWDEAARCVLIIRDPRRSLDEPGRPCQRPVSLMDLYPTIASLAGAPRPPHVAGQDLTPLLRDPQTPWPLEVLTTLGEGNHALSTARYRYLRYGQDPNNAELYDVEQDPAERTNRIDNPTLQATRRRLDAALERALVDPCRVPVATGPIGGYLFAHMTRADYGRLYYALSRDGLHWRPLNDGRCVLPDYRGHPDITRGRDGRYYLLGMKPDTTLIRVWVSTDLVSWRVLRDLQPALDHLPAFNPPTPWHGAPKMFYDRATDRYVITWHSATVSKQVAGADPYWGSMRSLYVTTRDFERLSEPRRLLPYDLATIDVILRREGETYYAFVKDEKAPDAEWPTGKTIRVCTAPTALGPYSPPSAPVSPSFREAPALIPQPGGYGWYLYYEQYVGRSYGCARAPSLAGPWHELWCHEYEVPAGARHGCMLALSPDQVETLHQRFGP